MTQQKKQNLLISKTCVDNKWSKPQHIFIGHQENIRDRNCKWILFDC